MVAGITEDGTTEIPTLAYFFTAQSSDADCPVDFTSVGKPSTCFKVISDGVLVQVSSLDGLSQQVVPALLLPRFLQLYHYSFQAGHPGERQL